MSATKLIRFIAANKDVSTSVYFIQTFQHPSIPPQPQPTPTINSLNVSIWPRNIPYPPINDNVPKLKQYLLDQFKDTDKLFPFQK